MLTCERESDNTLDRYAVAVKMEGNIVGHLPRKPTGVCSLFLRRGDTIDCTVTGCRRYSVVLPQGGLEIPFPDFQGNPRRNSQTKEGVEKQQIIRRIYVATVTLGMFVMIL